MTKKDIFNAIKENPKNATGNLYSFVANNYWQCYREDLADTLKELDYCIYEFLEMYDLQEEFHAKFLEDLEFQWQEYLEDEEQ